MRWDRSRTHVEVQLIALDDYAEQASTRPELIKIDAESHEYEVLVGARTLLSTTRPIVVVEVVKHRRDEVLELIEATATRRGASSPTEPPAYTAPSR